MYIPLKCINETQLVNHVSFDKCIYKTKIFHLFSILTKVHIILICYVQKMNAGNKCLPNILVENKNQSMIWQSNVINCTLKCLTLHYIHRFSFFFIWNSQSWKLHCLIRILISFPKSQFFDIIISDMCVVWFVNYSLYTIRCSIFFQGYIKTRLVKCALVYYYNFLSATGPNITPAPAPFNGQTIQKPVIKVDVKSLNRIVTLLS